MFFYTKAAVERAMQVQEVILRAMAKKITWWQAAEIIGISDRQMRRWRERYEQFGFRGLFDRRRGRPSPKRVPVTVMEKVLGLYRDRYFDLNVRHFHEKLGSHFWLTPKAGGAVDPQRPTQVGRALRDLGIQMIPAYSPQARGRSERNFGTWQGRLPQELRIHGIKSLDAANAFLRERYIAEFNQRFQVAAAERGSAFLPRRGQDLERVFSLQWERTVNRDNTVTWQNLALQIEPVKWRATLAGCTVTVHQHLDATLSLRYGPHCLGRYSAQGVPVTRSAVLPRVMEKTAVKPPWKTLRVSHFPTTSAAAQP